MTARSFSPNLPAEWYATSRPEHDDEALGAFASGDIDTLVRLAGEHPLPVAVVSGLSDAEKARVGEAVSHRLTFTLRGGRGAA
jgi:hypothetical protein